MTIYNIIAAILILILIVDLLYNVYKICDKRVKKNYNSKYFNHFKSMLREDSALVIVTDYKGKYYQVYSCGYYLSYDKETHSVFVNEKPVKISITDIDYFYSKLVFLRNSDIEVKMLYVYR